MSFLEELNMYLKGDKINDDYWYDNALFVCQDILEQFTIDDWASLVKELSNEDDRWKKRLVECLGSFNNSYELMIILDSVKTSNEELFISAIDALRCVDLTKLSMAQKEKIGGQVKEAAVNASPPVRKVFDEFLEETGILLIDL